MKLGTIALACWLVAGVIAILVTRRGTWQNRTVFISIFAAVGVGFAGGTIATLGYGTLAAVAVIVTLWSLIDRKFDAKRWWNRAVDPIVLESPFADAWRVSAGGPEPRFNHHQAVSDQYFAYDFLPEDGDASDREILAPCDGTVAWTEDRLEGGNYVSIETRRGFVIVKNLKKGSISVRVADTVRAGLPIGRCGNPGNTTKSHLHLHAQDRPQVAVDVAQGIPIAFLDANGVAQVLEYGDVLHPVTFASPAKQ